MSFLRSALASSLIVPTASAQVTVSWQQRFDAGVAEVANAVAIGPEGNVYVTGTLDPAGFPNFDYDVLTLAYDAGGAFLWSRVEPSPGKEIGGAVTVDPGDGAVYVAASAGFANQSAVRVFKYASDGTPLWATSPYHGTSYAWVNTPLALDAAGNVYVGGTTGDALASTDLFVLGFDPAGGLRWATTIDGPAGAGDAAGDLVVDPAGEAYVAGLVDSVAGGSKIATARVSSAGALVWLRTSDPLPGQAQGSGGIGLDPTSGDVLVAAVSNPPTATPTVPNARVLRYSAAGVLTATTILPDSHVYLTDLEVDAAGHAVVAGYRSVGGVSDFLTARVAPGGALDWLRTLDLESDFGESVVVDAAGEITVAGHSAYSPGGLLEYDMVALRYAPDGALRWVEQVTSTGTGRDFLRGLARSADGELQLAGPSSLYVNPLVLGPADALTLRLRPQSDPFCAGDALVAACPCGQHAPALAQRGCTNSIGANAGLVDGGDASLAADTLALTTDGMLASSLSILLQGDAAVSPAAFGDGLRCVGGNLKRLYVANAVGGAITVPGPGDPSVSARSAALGDPIAPGSTRYLQTYYRDPDAAFCPPPQGGTFNASSGRIVRWRP